MTSAPRRRSLVRGAVAAGSLLVLAGCDEKQNWFHPKGEVARKINDLQTPVFIIAGIVGLIVSGAVLAIIVLFREKEGKPEGFPKQIHGNPKLEIGWTLAPAVLLAIIAVPTISTIFDIAKKPANAMTVDVIGNQWWWEYDYNSLTNANGQAIVTSGELVLPAGPEVVLRITSRDVIHSFWIPQLAGKRDAVPNRVTSIKIQADQPGEYWGQCTEFCGLSHANMRMRVVALSDADWQKWVANQEKDAATPADATSLAAQGQAVFAAQCTRCHQVNGLKDAAGNLLYPKDVKLVSGAAPNLTHLMSRTTFAGASFDLKKPDCVNGPTYDATYPTGTADQCVDSALLSEWLRNAPAMKPMAPTPNKDGNGRGMPYLGLSEKQISQLVAYLSTLK